jgi:hypothetical protein
LRPAAWRAHRAARKRQAFREAKRWQRRVRLALLVLLASLVLQALLVWLAWPAWLPEQARARADGAAREQGQALPRQAPGAARVGPRDAVRHAARACHAEMARWQPAVPQWRAPLQVQVRVQVRAPEQEQPRQAPGAAQVAPRAAVRHAGHACHAVMARWRPEVPPWRVRSWLRVRLQAQVLRPSLPVRASVRASVQVRQPVLPSVPTRQGPAARGDQRPCPHDQALRVAMLRAPAPRAAARKRPVWVLVGVLALRMPAPSVRGQAGAAPRRPSRAQPP